jgi:acetyltransferase-like isoleucine patch superfamily enzyme
VSRRLPVYVKSAICTVWFRLRGVRAVVGCDGRLPVLYGGGTVTIGAGFGTRSRVARSEIGALPGGRLGIGDRVFVNQGASVVASRSVEIGDGTLIGDFAAVYDTDHHALDSGRPVKTAPVVIGRNVWLGRGVIVLPGSVIGDHSVIAAGSVVRGEIPARVLATGNPAVPVRELTITDGWLRT